jgi:hypothetical protein
MVNGDPQRIAEVINWWLQEEIVNSDAGLNAYLSEFVERRADLDKSFDDPTNFMAAKAISHDSRFKFFVENYGNTDSILDDRGASRFIFAALMAVSGGYRKQCVVEAVSAQDYLHRRRDLGPTSINVLEVVTAELSSVQLPDLTMDEMVARSMAKTLQVKDRIIELDQLIYNGAIQRFTQDGSTISPDSPPVVAMQETQSIGISLATAHIAVAAALRGGDYEKVPVLEPKTITEAAIIYPFAQQARIT